MSSNDNFISRAVQAGVSTAGGYAGGVVDAAGKSVSGAGRNVGDRCVHKGATISTIPYSLLDWCKKLRI